MNSLTSTEKLICEILSATGASNKDIAEKLGIGEGTVRTHLRSIFQKYDVKSRAELIVKYKNQ